jgi:hypothetical protein
MENRDERMEERAQSERDRLDESLGMHVELRPGKTLSRLEEPPAVEQADWPRFRRLTFFSVLAGLCPLIPLPFVDDWAVGLIHRRMVRELGESRGLELADGEIRLLAGTGERRWPGLLKGTALAVRRGVGKIVGKLFKTAFYVLLLREGIHRAVETFVEGYLLLHAAGLPQALRPSGRTPERVRAVRAAVVSTMKEVDVTPIHKAVGRSFERSFGLLSEAAAKLGARLSPWQRRAGTASAAVDTDDASVPLQEEEELLGGFVDQLAGSLWGDQEYFESLERAFEERLARERPAVAG